MTKLLKIAMATALIAMLAVPAVAATEWEFGATIQFKTFYNHVNYGDRRGDDLEGGGAGGLKNDGYLDWTTQSDSNINMTMYSDRLEGYAEINYDFAENSVTTNYLWGRYFINDNMSVLIGQTDPLFIQEISNQVVYDNANLNGFGTANSDTLPMIALQYGGFTFAMAQPMKNFDETFDANVAFIDSWGGPTPDGYTADIDTFMPQLHASFNYEADTWRIKFAGAYANSRVKKLALEYGGAEYSFGSKTISSWLVGMDSQVFFGPLTLGAAISYGANWDFVGWNEGMGVAYPVFTPKSGFNSFRVKDTHSLMAALVVGYQLTESLGFEAGVGYRRDDNSMFDKAIQSWATYIQAVYEVTPGFRIIPEIGYMNYGDSPGAKSTRYNDRVKGNIDEGYEWYAGVQWRFDF